jgi:hypothetical protein
MYRITIAVLLSTAIGCSTSRSATGGLAAREGNGTVAGIIALSEGVSPGTGDFCAGVTVKVTPSSTSEDALGDRMVKMSRNRCSYQVARLPNDAELQLAVTPSAAWSCDNGATPTLTPEPQALTLRDYETLTRDFRVSCPVAEAAPATP